MTTLIKRVFSPKNTLILTLALATSSLALAEDFNFKFNFKGEVWSRTVNAGNKTTAFEIASQECLNHFTGSDGKNKIQVDAATADALIDTCANPR